ncbi:MAG: glycosyltransferase family 39 protein [Chloroflexi bacterium]|nr:glycosyltransferase family 39 protein [Chloroflexota bacterium]
MDGIIAVRKRNAEPYEEPDDESVSGVLTDSALTSGERGAPSARPAVRPGAAALPMLLAFTLGGAIWRVVSFVYNIWPHGDVVLDAGIAESVAWRGQLLVPIVDVRYFPIGRFGFGYPPDQHPPIWPLLGASLVPLTGDGYTALKIVSLLIGVLLVPLAYLALRRHIGHGPAAFASFLTAASYPLVDFSANGSLWVLLAAFYLGWLWLLPEAAENGGLLHMSQGAAAPSRVAAPNRATAPLGTTPDDAEAPSPRAEKAAGAWRGWLGRWTLLGLLMGLAYLTNYPAVVLPASLVLLLLVRHGRGLFRRSTLAGPLAGGAVMLLTISPWLIHNAGTFGSPIWSQPFQRTLAGGSRQVEFAIVDGEVIKRNRPVSSDRVTALRERAIDLYGNVGFVARQAVVLGPVLAGLFLCGLLAVGADLVPWSRSPRPLVRSTVERRVSDGTVGWPGGPADARQDTRADAWHPQPIHPGQPAPFAVVVLAVVHLALILLWPTTKFRYLVPLLPLVFAIGGWFLWRLGPPRQRLLLAVVTAGLCLFTNVWTMLEIPSRTYYYDGGLVDDNFGQQGEIQFVEQAKHLRAAADAIVSRGPGVVLGEHLLAPLTRHPLVVNSTAYPSDVLAALVARYDVRYVVDERARAGAYAFLDPTEIWSDDRYMVLELPRPERAPS